MKFIVGLTGLYCAGKNEAAKVFVETGFREIDVDALGHVVLEEKKKEILNSFGDGIVTPSGQIDRKRLGNIVFRDRKELEKLEQIVHPSMVVQVKQLIDQENSPIVINAALLYKMKLDSLCNRIVIIRAPLLERINRCMDRDGLDVFSTLYRIFAQRKLIPQSSLHRADTVVVNNRGTRGELRVKILELIRQWTEEMGLVWNRIKLS
ncbi:MAG: dephospho-CoA kinase [Spirochaetes bacterium]|nr:dephospho-CoA kinase [Spirochaetota bacterium]